MPKTVSLLTRRADFTQPAFQDYTERVHAPLAAAHIPFDKYVRNHLQRTEAGTLPGDLFGEFWQDRPDLARAVLAGPAGEQLKQDKARCQDLARQCSGESEELLLAGSPRDVAAPGTRRRILVLGRGSLDEAAFRESVAAWGRSLATAGFVRVTLDLVRPDGHGRPFPADALVSLWLAPGQAPGAVPAAPAGLAMTACVLAEVCETPPERLVSL